MADFEKLRGLAEDATPGPWFVETIREGREVSYVVSHVVRWRGYTNGLCFGEDKDTAEFIAACSPGVVVAMLDEIERLRAGTGPSPPTATELTGENLGDRGMCEPGGVGDGPQ